MEYDALPSLKSALRKAQEAKVGWWTLRSENLADHVHYPVTTAPDEWANELLNLDQLLIEGLEERWLRQKAAELGRKPDPRSRSLKLLEECLMGLGFEADHAHEILSPLHEVHNLRSIMKGHATGGEAKKLRADAVRKHGSLRDHFKDLCRCCDEAVRTIETTFSSP